MLAGSSMRRCVVYSKHSRLNGYDSVTISVKLQNQFDARKRRTHFSSRP